MDKLAQATYLILVFRLLTKKKVLTVMLNSPMKYPLLLKLRRMHMSYIVHYSVLVKEE